MSENLGSLIRTSFDCSGYLESTGKNKRIPAKIHLDQYITGRIAFEAYIEEKNWSPLFNRAISHSFLDFSGQFQDSSHVSAKGLWTENLIYKNSGDVTLQGFIYHPGFIEVTLGDVPSTPCNEIVCELTNVVLLGRGPIHMKLDQMDVTFTEVAQYRLIRNIMSTLKSDGILCEMRILCSSAQCEDSENLIMSLTSLISLSQRTYVWSALQIYKDRFGNIIRKIYQEPIFHYFRPVRPLIPVEYLEQFLKETWKNYQDKYQIWKFGLAQDYYLHAMMLNSIWPKSIGFFTALETLKQAYLEQTGKQKSIENYVPEGRFKKHDIFQKVMDILGMEFPEYARLLEQDQDDAETRRDKQYEIETIKSKVGELNRRAYKMILKAMFQDIHIDISDAELNNLVKLRNDIIHRGTPRNVDENDSYGNSFRFGSLLEKIFLALLEYQGKKEYYHEGESINQ